MSINVPLNVVPAYGRDYDLAADVEKDWNANKDFRSIRSGAYTNKGDAEILKEMGFTHVRVFYKEKTRSIDIQL